MIRHNFNEVSGDVFTGVTPKKTFGMDDFSQSILPNADTGRFDDTMNDEPYKQNDLKAANTMGGEAHQTPGIEGQKKLESKSIALQSGLDAIMEMLSGAPEPGESFSESGLVEVEAILHRG